MPEPMRFDGATIAEDPDAEQRLTGQMLGVFEAMSDGQWHTLPELAEKVVGSEAGVSARIRDLRKPRFGAHEVQRRHDRMRGVFEYRLVVRQGASA